ncbi:uncharacterized protein V6R79_000176 [Siganus canaliculatus]
MAAAAAASVARSRNIKRGAANQIPSPEKTTLTLRYEFDANSRFPAAALGSLQRRLLMCGDQRVEVDLSVASVSPTHPSHVAAKGEKFQSETPQTLQQQQQQQSGLMSARAVSLKNKSQQRAQDSNSHWRIFLMV